MAICELPENPDLEHLRNQAKALQRAVRAGTEEALALVAEFHPRLSQVSREAGGLARFSRADAQLVIARRYGLASWSALREHLARVAEHTRQPHRDPGGALPDEQGVADAFLRLACLTYGNDDVAHRDRARAMLDADPGIGTVSIHTMAAVGEVAAVAELLATAPAHAARQGGPHGWEPLHYAAYSRLDSTRPGHSTLEVARLLLRLDRIGRSLRHLVDLVGDLRSRKIGFRSLNDPIDTTSASGRLVFHVFAALAEFERDLTRERTTAGVAAARARGRVGGRPRVMTPEKIRLARRLYDDGDVTVQQIAETLGVSRRSIYRGLRTPQEGGR